MKGFEHRKDLLWRDSTDTILRFWDPILKDWVILMRNPKDSIFITLDRAGNTAYSEEPKGMKGEIK